VRVRNILRRIVSGHRSTSINALHKLLLIEKIELRNASLSIRFADKLHNCTDKSIPAIRLWWSGLSDRNKNSLIEPIVSRNQFWRDAKKLNHVFNRLTPYYNKPMEMYSKIELKIYSIIHIENIEPYYPSTIAGSIEVAPGEKHHHLLKPNKDLDPK
ncbi:hypothetical protein ROZALSC1DRAFT_26375, partial [Rozella allomycis CSF55]